MTKGILVDTCSLISYVDERQPHHDAARQYIQHALSTGVKVFLSGLVVAEFSRRQNIMDIGLSNFVPSPFNIPDGLVAAKFAELVKRESGEDRSSVLVDVMLIAQAHRLQLESILTDDVKLVARLERLNDLKETGVKAVLTTNGFDPALLIDPSAPGLPLRVVK